VEAVSFTSDGRGLLTTGPDQALLLWNPRTGAQVPVDDPDRMGLEPPLFTEALSPDGRITATALGNYATESGGGPSLIGTKYARLWHADGRPLATLRGHASFVNDLEFSRDSRRVATASDDETARVWDSGTGRSLVVLRGSTAEVWSAAFSNDGRRVVTAGVDGAARIWDVQADLPLVELPGTEGAVSPHGTFAAAVAGGEVRVWQTAHRRIVASFNREPGTLERIGVGDDGRVAVAVYDRPPETFDASSGRRVPAGTRSKDPLAAALARTHASFIRAELSRDGRTLVTVSGDVSTASEEREGFQNAGFML
jgi:WD40 repeat protein